MSTITLEQDSLLGRLKRMDLFLLGFVAFILLISVVFIGSAAQGIGEGSGAGYAARQALFICMRLTVFAALQRVDYLTILRHASLLYLISLVLLCGVYGTRAINGAHSWYNLYV